MGACKHTAGGLAAQLRQHRSHRQLLCLLCCRSTRCRIGPPVPQTAALRKLGLTLAVDSGSGNQLSGAQLLAAVAAAERERAGTAGDAPLGEWEVLKVKDVDAGGFCTMQMESGGFGWKVGPGWKDLSGREVN